VRSYDLAPAQLDDLIALCSGVFGLDYAYYMDLCPERMHVLGYAEGKLVSHALWLERRMWVAPLAEAGLEPRGPAEAGSDRGSPLPPLSSRAGLEPRGPAEAGSDRGSPLPPFSSRRELRAAYVEGVATHPDYRQRGYGSALMRRLQDEITARRYELGALSPARAARSWYERLGWARWQGPLLIDKDGLVWRTDEDCVMFYRTPCAGALDPRQALIGAWRPFELW